MSWVAAAVVVAVIHLVLAEVFDWFPALARHLIRRAAHRLPAAKRDRYAEEWLAELAALPGQRVSALVFSARILVRARSTARALGEPIPGGVLAYRLRWGALLLFLAPALAMVAVAIKLASPGPVFIRREIRSRSGRVYRLREFRADEATLIGVFVKRHGIVFISGAIDIVTGSALRQYEAQR